LGIIEELILKGGQGKLMAFGFVLVRHGKIVEPIECFTVFENIVIIAAIVDSSVRS
jgi:hypothetical protein